jgi:hypothetical protein
LSNFTPDPLFLQRAILAIRQLEHLIETTPRANHRLDRLAADLDAVYKRYARGNHCFGCNASTKLPAIVSIVFCGESCRRIKEDRETETEKLIQESIAEHNS